MKLTPLAAKCDQCGLSKVTCGFLRIPCAKCSSSAASISAFVEFVYNSEYLGMFKDLLPSILYVSPFTALGIPLERLV